MSEQERANVFVVHSWDEPESYARMLDLLNSHTAGLAHYSIPAWRPLNGGIDDVLESIEMRIRMATAVVVLNTPGLHKREWSGFEMKAAVAMAKRIIVVQPPGDFDLAVPGVLDGSVYRYSSWRGDVVGRAIRGEYPDDGRIFEIAELVDRRRLVGLLAVGVVAASFVVVAATTDAWRKFERDLAAASVGLSWNRDDTDRLVAHTLIGAAVGGLLGCLTSDGKSTMYMAGAGAAVGAALAFNKVYRARLRGAGHIRVLVVEAK